MIICLTRQSLKPAAGVGAKVLWPTSCAILCDHLQPTLLCTWMQSLPVIMTIFSTCVECNKNGRMYGWKEGRKEGRKDNLFLQDPDLIDLKRPLKGKWFLDFFTRCCNK